MCNLFLYILLRVDEYHDEDDTVKINEGVNIYCMRLITN